MTNNLQKMLWAKINFLLFFHMSHQTASDKYDVDVILESTAISVDFGGHHREIGDLCTQIEDNSGFLSPRCYQWFLYFSWTLGVPFRLTVPFIVIFYNVHSNMYVKFRFPRIFSRIHRMRIYVGQTRLGRINLWADFSSLGRFQGQYNEVGIVRTSSNPVCGRICGYL